MLCAVELFGLGTSDHALPFHDSISVRFTPLWFSYRPTAVHDFGVRHTTSYRRFQTAPGLGLGTICQALPTARAIGEPQARPRSHPPRTTVHRLGKRLLRRTLR